MSQFLPKKNTVSQKKTVSPKTRFPKKKVFTKKHVFTKNKFLPKKQHFFIINLFLLQKKNMFSQNKIGKKHFQQIRKISNTTKKIHKKKSLKNLKHTGTCKSLPKCLKSSQNVQKHPKNIPERFETYNNVKKYPKASQNVLKNPIIS